MGGQTLIDRVQNEMLSDDEDRHEQSALLQRIYAEMDENVKNKVDEIFICLCGWSLKILINRKEE